MDLARIPITDRNSVMTNTVTINSRIARIIDLTALANYFFFTGGFSPGLLNFVSTVEPMV